MHFIWFSLLHKQIPQRRSGNFADSHIKTGIFKRLAQKMKPCSLTLGWRWANRRLQEERGWWGWMPPLAIRIHTSVIHLTASHRNDPPVTCSESPGPSPLLPACFLSVYIFLSLSFSSYGAQQHTERRLTVSLPRPSKKREESIFRYRQLLLTGERPQR